MRTFVPSPKAAGNELVRGVTGRAPHVRHPGDLASIMRGVLFALVPCLFFGLYNAGSRANLALAELGSGPPPGWRGSLLASIGVGIDASSMVDCFGWGTAFFLPLLVASAVTGFTCEWVFSRLRDRRPNPGLAVTVLLFTLCLPPTLPIWQAALGIAFGVIVGREVFGGTGRNFLNPALTGLAFVYFSYPISFKGIGVWTAVDGYTGATSLGVAALGGMEAVHATGSSWLDSFLGHESGSFGETSTLACLLGVSFLLLRRIASWQIIAGTLLGLVGTVLIFQALGVRGAAADVPWYWHLTLGGFAFGALFMATDPISSAMTPRGRWLYGGFIGFLVVLIRVRSPVHPEAVMLAILLGNLFAPLIDHGVIWLKIRGRDHRHA